jgi:hypothetical protein
MKYKDFRPIPPIDKEGYAINLLKLYMVVKEMGGFEAVTSWDAWEEVSIKIGHRDREGDRMRDVYEKYLEVIGWFGDKVREERIEVKEGECSRNYAGDEEDQDGDKDGDKNGDQDKPLKKRKHGKTKEDQENKD